MFKGKINLDGLTPDMLLRGWNMFAAEAGSAVFEIRKLQEAARREGDYAMADKLRAISTDLDEAMQYVGIEFTPNENIAEAV